MRIMPHFGLIKEGIAPDEEALIRAKLHMRSGDIRMRKGELSDAIASYYDAFSSAMLRFFVSDVLRKKYFLPDSVDITDDHALFLILKEKGVINDSFTDVHFHQIETLLEAAFEGWVEKCDYHTVLTRLDSVMKQLDIIPILPGEVPDENSVTL